MLELQVLLSYHPQDELRSNGRSGNIAKMREPPSEDKYNVECLNVIKRDDDDEVRNANPNQSITEYIGL